MTEDRGSLTGALVKRLPYLLPLLMFVGMAVYFWAGLGKDPHVLPSVLLDQAVPAFETPPIAGSERGLSSADLHGQVTLVNVFGSWCVACQVEHPVLMEIAATGAVPIYGIDWREKNRQDGPAWLAQHGNPYARIGDDPDSRAAIAFGVTGAPESFIVDAAGIIRYKVTGPITREIWEGELWPIIERLRRG